MKRPDVLRRPANVIFLAVLLCCGWFYAQGGWNQNARYDMIYSFVEPGTPDFLTFRIDHFLIDAAKTVNTGDWAVHNGHYYSNKAPGASLLGIPVYAALYWLEYPFHRGVIPPRLDMFNAWAINFFVSVLPVAVAAALLYLTLRRLNGGGRRAAFWALLFGLATPLWPYSTMMWGHPLAAAALVGALFHLVRNRKYDLFFCGFWCGAAVLTDYLALPAAAAFGLYLLLRSPKTVWKFIAGGIPILLLFAAYHAWCFGAPFTPATMFNNPRFLEAGKAGGVLGSFSPLIALKLLFGSYRGLLAASPVLLAALPGFLCLQRRDRAAAWCAAGAFLAGVWINAGFNGWHGGLTTTARYLIPLVPCLVFLAAAWQPKSWISRLLLLSLTGLSLFNMLAIASATPMVAEEFRSPLYGTTWELFFQGAMRLFPLNGIRTYFLHPEVWKELHSMASFSLGTLLFGLKQPGSILLLGVLLFAVLWPLRPRRAELRTLLPQQCSKPEPLTLLVAGALLLYLLFPGDVPWSLAEVRIHQAALEADKVNQFYSAALPGVDPWSVRFRQLLLLFTANPAQAVLLQSLLFAAVILFSLRKIGMAAGFDWRYPAALLFASHAVRHLCRMPNGAGFRLPLLLFTAALVLPELLRSSGRRKVWWFLAGGVLIPLPALLTSPSGEWGGALPEGFRLLSGFGFATEWLPEYRNTLVLPAGTLVFAALAGFALAGVIILIRRRNFGRPAGILLLTALWLAAILLAASLRFSIDTLLVFPALLLAWCGIESAGPAGKRLCLWTVGVQLAMTLILTLQIHANAGTRNGRYGPTLSCQQKVVQAILQQRDQVGLLELRDTTGRSPEPLQFLLRLAGEEKKIRVRPPEDPRRWVGELSFDSDDPASGWMRVVFAPEEEKTQP